jgi:hypothetical protein
MEPFQGHPASMEGENPAEQCDLAVLAYAM